MAMLAGPRRKQKVINLRAKNNAWSNDSTKFGQRMLEKMGWSEGKGLGANENGIVEHVVARFKNDDRGLGFEDKNDQWTKHEDDFNSLLANLSNGDNNDDKLHSGVSLEVKSKKSKARVHYHKFTRGKDLTRYSEKDLANIFGKKTLKEVKDIAEEKEQTNDIEPLVQTEKVFTEKGSMEDYFKSKLAAIKSRGKLNITQNNTNDDDEADYTFRGFSGATNGDNQEESHQSFGFQSFSYNTSNDGDTVEKENTECPDDTVEYKKKIKKKKKNKCDEDIVQDNLVIDTEINFADGVAITDESQEIKKSKKKKKKQEFEEAVEESIDSKKSKKKLKKLLEAVEITVVSKKSKKKKNVVESVEEHVVDNYVPKKKKKRKNKEIDE